MKSGVILIALLALSVMSRPIDVIYVCNMTAESVAEAELDLFSVIHFPVGREMGCAELVTMERSERDALTLCEYAKFENGTSDWGWWHDLRWTNVLVKCKRLCAYCPPPYSPYPFRKIPDHQIQLRMGSVGMPCYRLSPVLLPFMVEI